MIEMTMLVDTRIANSIKGVNLQQVVLMSVVHSSCAFQDHKGVWAQVQPSVLFERTRLRRSHVTRLSGRDR